MPTQALSAITGVSYTIDSAIKTLPNGKQIIVDREDAHILFQRSWHINASGYAISGDLSVHREVMKAVKGQEVHHKNENKLDCRKHNLAFVSHQKNLFLAGRRADNTSGWKGVTFVKRSNKWQAQICVAGRNIHLGTFICKEDAIAARRQGEVVYHG